MNRSAPSSRGSSGNTSREKRRHEEHVQLLRGQIDEALTALEPRATPALLYEPVRYVLEGGGKRLRPLLLLLTAEAFGAQPDEAMPAALAVEVFHNFTLVHDDIMDRAAHRRGRQAVHRRWDTGTALLAGDLLLVRAYDLLAEMEAPNPQRLLRPFRRMARRLCEGQALDKTFETQAQVSVDDYLRMIDGKTAALLSAALEIGALAGGAADAKAAALGEAGAALGRAFQIQDDLLDLTAEDDRWGKPVGADLVEGKKTFLLLCALERAARDSAAGTSDDRAFFTRVLEEEGLPPDDVPEARRRMRTLGVPEEARRAVARHTETARERLRALPDGPSAGTLRWLIGKMQTREH